MAIVWYIIADGASSMTVALSGIMAFLPQGILGLFLGVYIDRYNRKKIMVWSDLLIALASLSIVIAGIFGEIPITLIMIVLAVRSIGIALSGVLSYIIGVNWCFVFSGIGMIFVSIIYFKISQKFI